MSILDHIIDVKVDEAKGYANDPRLLIYLDHNNAMPDFWNVPHTRYGSYVFAESNGVGRFFSHNGDGKNHGGYGGSIYRVPVKNADGSVDMMSFGGPWSGNESTANVFVPDYWSGMVYYIPRYKATGLAGAVIRLDLAMDAMEKFCPEWELYAVVRLNANGEIGGCLILPKRVDEAPKNPSLGDTHISDLFHQDFKNPNPNDGYMSADLSSEQSFAVYGGR